MRQVIMVEVPSYRDKNAAPGERLHPAIALVNSRRNDPAGAVDELASRATARAWLKEHGFSPARCTTTELAALRELRDAVRALLLARIGERVPDPGAVQVVNEAAAAAPAVAQLEWSAEAPAAVPVSLATSGIALARSRLAADAIELLTGADHARLRACAAPGCVRVLLRDHSRRQWCSTRCGDRVRASRYYHRHRAWSEQSATDS